MLAVGLLASSAAAEGWGTLVGRFVVEGSVPKPVAHAPGNDPVCHAAAPIDDSVLVGEEGGLANAVVYVRPPRGKVLSVHPDLAAAAEPIELTNRQCAFLPRVSVVQTGQPLVVKNDDPTAHNTKFDLLKNTALNQLIPAGGEFTATFDTAESLPTPVSCNVHPFMRGYVLVRDDPYAAISDADGRFKIEHLPAGEHQFQLWHETGYLKEVAFKGGEADRRGRMRLTIPADGELDLGEVRVPAELLLRK